MRVLDFSLVVKKGGITPVPPIDTAERLRQAYKRAETNGKVLEESKSVGGDATSSIYTGINYIKDREYSKIQTNLKEHYTTHTS